MKYYCTFCNKEVSPATCFVRVTGWGKPTKTGLVKEIIGAGAAHGLACDSCIFDLKNGTTPKTESLF